MTLVAGIVVCVSRAGGVERKVASRGARGRRRVVMRLAGYAAGPR